MSVTDSFFRTLSLTDVILRVRDLDRVRAFYTERIGFQVTPGENGAVGLSPTGRPPVLLRLVHDPEAPPATPGSAGLFHIAFLYPDRPALGRALRGLLDDGMRVGGADHGVSEALYLTDPEGNGLELYADRSPADWPPSPGGGQVGMFTEPLDFPSLLHTARRSAGHALPAETRVGHLHLRVSDLDSAERFYAGHLGIPVRQRDYPGARFFGRDGYHHHLGANVWHSRRAVTPGAAGLARFTLRVADDEAYAVLARSLSGEGLVAAGNSTWLETRDGDGLVIRVTLRDEAGA